MSVGGPTISIVIPTRDRWELFQRMGLVAALSQVRVDFEVVVVDDASSQPCPIQLAREDDRVRVVRQSERRGIAAARNLGIAEAQGDWIAFLDDDDAWAPEKLRTQLGVATATGADFVYCSAVSIDGTGTALQEYPAPEPDALRRELLARCVIPAGSSNVLARAELLRSVGGFDEQFRALDDWDCWIRLAWAGTGASASDVLVAYLEHLEGVSVALSGRALVELRALDRKHRALRRECGVELDAAGFMHYVAWLQLRRRSHATAAGIYLRSAVSNRRPTDLIPAARFAVRALLPVDRPLRRDVNVPALEAPTWLARYRPAWRPT